MKALPLLALALACAALVLSLSSPIVLAEVSVCSAPSDGATLLFLPRIALPLSELKVSLPTCRLQSEHPAD